MLTKISTLVLLALLYLPYTQAQICIPDSQYTSGGIYPESLPPHCQNEAYNQVITAVVPKDTLVPIPPFGTLNAPINFIRLDTVLNLPPGISYQCVPPTCEFPGGSSGCILMTGTPTVAGTYSILSVTTAEVSLGILGNLQQVDTSLLYDFIVLAQPSLSILNLSNTTCGQANGAVQVKSQSGTPPYDYLWSNGQTGASVIGLSAGPYTVTVSDSNNCMNTINVNIGSSSQPSTSLLTTTDPNCNGQSSGSIAVQTSSGSSPYSYLWSNSATTKDLSNVAAGNYYMIVTDAQGCKSDTLFANLGEPAPLTNFFEIKDETSPTSSDGELEVMTIGGTSPYIYIWTGGQGQTTSLITSLSQGTYLLRTIDDQSCIRNDTIVLGVRPCSKDSYEPNDDYQSATLVSSNSFASQFNTYLCPIGEEDWYQYYYDGAQPYLSIKLSNLPEDYDLQLYAANGTSLISQSANTGTLSEMIVSQSLQAGNYYVRVYSQSDQWHPTKAYNLTINTHGTGNSGGKNPGLIYSPTTFTLKSRPDKISVYPNPADHLIQVQHTLKENTLTQVRISTLQGAAILKEDWDINPGEVLEIPTNKLAEGIYLLSLEGEGIYHHQKLLIFRR